MVELLTSEFPPTFNAVELPALDLGRAGEAGEGGDTVPLIRLCKLGALKER